MFLTSPNNPTGNALTPAEAEAVCEMDALVVVDEAYIEFGGTSVVPLIARHPNLVVLRTFSKWAGLAGLRVGYSISCPEIARRVDGDQAAVQRERGGGRGGADGHRASRRRSSRPCSASSPNAARLMAGLAALGWLEPLPSEANFVLSRCHGGADARGRGGSCAAAGILVRYYDRPDLANYIRVSVGRPQDTDRLLAALGEL